MNSMLGGERENSGLGREGITGKWTGDWGEREREEREGSQPSHTGAGRD